MNFFSDTDMVRLGIVAVVVIIIIIVAVVSGSGTKTTSSSEDEEINNEESENNKEGSAFIDFKSLRKAIKDAEVGTSLECFDENVNTWFTVTKVLGGYIVITSNADYGAIASVFIDGPNF